VIDKWSNAKVRGLACQGPAALLYALAPVSTACSRAATPEPAPLGKRPASSHTMAASWLPPGDCIESAFQCDHKLLFFSTSLWRARLQRLSSQPANSRARRVHNPRKPPSAALREGLRIVVRVEARAPGGVGHNARVPQIRSGCQRRAPQDVREIVIHVVRGATPSSRHPRPSLAAQPILAVRFPAHVLHPSTSSPGRRGHRLCSGNSTFRSAGILPANRLPGTGKKAGKMPALQNGSIRLDDRLVVA